MISALRRLLSRLGYVLWKKEFLRYGVSPFVDVRRINQEWGRTVEVVFDVGSNVGQFALEASGEWPDAQILSFEPHPETFHRLKETIQGRRISAHQLAFGDRESESLTMYDYGNCSTINSLTRDARFPKEFGYSAQEIQVPCSTIDTFCTVKGISRIDFLKVDTEGFDLHVLKGAEQMLRSGRISLVYVEFNDLFASFQGEGGALIPLASYLAGYNFRYLVTYTDFVFHKRKVSVCANALFGCPPD